MWCLLAGRDCSALTGASLTGDRAVVFSISRHVGVGRLRGGEARLVVMAMIMGVSVVAGRNRNALVGTLTAWETKWPST